MALLRDDPMQSGRLFKVIATYLSERIPSLVEDARQRVPIGVAAAGGVAGGAVGRRREGAADVPAAEDEKLLGIYQCSVRRSSTL